MVNNNGPLNIDPKVIETFLANKDSTILKLGTDSAGRKYLEIANKGFSFSGLITWVASKIFRQENYQMSSVVNYILANKQSIATLDQSTASQFYAVLDGKIQRYNQHHSTALPKVSPFQTGSTTSSQTSSVDIASLKPVTLQPLFGTIDSSKQKGIQIPGKASITERKDFLNSAWKPSPPILSKSEFVSSELAKHLMTKKKKTAIGVKYNQGDEITNMEGAMHTFLTPLGHVHMLGDYKYQGGHTVPLFGNNLTREVILSYAIHPDFENHEVMEKLLVLGQNKVQGEELPEDFKIPTAQEKANKPFRDQYDEQLRNHMVYHLTAGHALPAAAEVSSNQLRNLDSAIKEIEALILPSKNGEEMGPEDIRKRLEGKFLSHNGKVISLEMLFNVYLHQIRNEFSGLEQGCPQGYVYTMDPPSIFAAFFGNDATLLNRLQILGLKCLADNHQLKNLKVIGFNDFKDKGAIALLQNAMPADIKVQSKESLFSGVNGTYVGPAGYALVIHNNSDGFGDNITNEGSGGSIDGAIGSFSDAASVVKQTRDDLFDHVI